MQLVVSRWSTQSNGHQLQFTAFLPSEHGNKVNTAVNLTDIYNFNNDFSYVLHWSEEGAGDLRLYAKQSLVPHKFASALWSTLLEVNASVRSTDLQELGKSFTSKADLRAIRSFLPVPLFEVQAWDGSLTYAELDRLSTNVASQLVRKGVRVGQYVPFSFEKSVCTVVAVLGILKAGGAIVPIDPSQPQARVREIVRETRASMVIASVSQALTFANPVEAVLTISSNTVESLEDTFGVSTELPQVQPEDPAMLIFTSGSTGKPKGIVIQYRPAGWQREERSSIMEPEPCNLRHRHGIYL
ncbi:hypothetical protein ETB97_007975 [Aspergillus alliaceus]|uniref:AMP-dependent synthetase/ligase domain-containing protein n=1 Tax=Petromyces alliaceus TaxID=209559 RepID=A0A8H5ZX82_PETAA|nr:hypothetical protein ETB97_007975 [Aspergillus burnettii]